MNIKEFLKKNKNVTVAVSGGVDDALLLLLAKSYEEEYMTALLRTSFSRSLSLMTQGQYVRQR